MRKSLNGILAAIALATLVLLAMVSCQNNTINRAESDFIYIDDDVFKFKNDTFFPLMVNYIVSYQGNEKEGFIVAPSIDYDSAQYVEAHGKTEVQKQLDAHFSIIKEMGFNTVRVCWDRTGKDEDGRYYYLADRKYYLGDSKDRNAILKGMDDFVKTAAHHGLRLMLLIKPPFEADRDVVVFTKELLKHFQNEPTIFAYDFMNEPLYFDPEEKREKTDAVRIVSGWKKLMTKYAPNQLFTIAFSEPIEVFEWDCTLCPVDFVEIHTYHPLRVPSEIYWYSKHCNKPWMIGETGLPADGDSITYEEQALFVKEAYQLTRDAGGCGFGLWEYQETPFSHFEASFTGLINHEGTTQTADEKHSIKGTLKPAAKVVSTLADNYQRSQYRRPVNYYNMLGYKNIKIEGRIIDDKTGEAIEGAVVRGWNEDWSIGMNTYSDENGNFSLYCNNPCYHFEISAPGYSTAKFDKSIHFQSINNRKEDVYNLDGKDIEYHIISYHPFAMDNSVLTFDATLFNKAEWMGKIGNVTLKCIGR